MSDSDKWSGWAHVGFGQMAAPTLGGMMGRMDGFKERLARLGGALIPIPDRSCPSRENVTTKGGHALVVRHRPAAQAGIEGKGAHGAFHGAEGHSI
jgi:hypothetical protein